MALRLFPNLLVIGLVCFSLFVSTAGGADYSWTGAIDNNWSTAGNWAPSGPPTDSLTADTVTFNQSNYQNFQPNVGTRSITGITVGGTSGNLIFTGTNLSIGAGGFTILNGAGSINVTISTITVVGSQTWLHNSTNTLFFGGASGIDIGANALTIATNSTMTFNTVVGSVGTVSGSLTKLGAGTLNLNKANLFTGGLTIGGGTVNLDASGSNIGSLVNTNGLNFTGSGTFNYKAAATGSTQALGALTLTAGDASVQSTYGTSGNVSLTFASLSARPVGTTVNLVTSGGTNGTTNKIVLQDGAGNNRAPGFIDRGVFFSGPNYAWYDTGTTGFVRAISYGTDANTITFGAGTSIAQPTQNQIQVTGSQGQQASLSVQTLRLGTSVTITLASGATLSADGLLMGGTSTSTITGGAGVQTSTSDAELIARVDTSTLIVTTPILANGTNALTKSGGGILTLNGTAANTFTGITYVNAGTLTLDKTASVIAIPGDLTIGNGGTVNYTGNTKSELIADTSNVTILPGGKFVPGAMTDGGRETMATLTASGNGSTVSIDGVTGASATAEPIRVNGLTTMTGAIFAGNGTSTNSVFEFGGNLVVNASALTSAFSTSTYGNADWQLNLIGGTRTFNIVGNGLNGPAAANGIDFDIAAANPNTFMSLQNGRIIKSGAGTLRTNLRTDGSLAFTGWDLNAGRIIFNRDDALGPNGSSLVLNGGTISTETGFNHRNTGVTSTVAVNAAFNTGGVYNFDTTKGSMIFAITTFNDDAGSNRTFNVAANTLGFTTIGTPNGTVNFIKIGLGTLQFFGASIGIFNGSLAVNAGTLSMDSSTGAGSNTSVITFASGTTFNAGGAITRTTSQIVLPSAGAVFFTGNNGITLTGAYAPPTGTIAFGGVSTGNETTSQPTTVSVPQTIAFNQSGGGSFQFNGFALGASLTLVGTGNAGIAGVGIPQGSAGGLGSISQDSSPRSITVALAPIGQVSMNTTVSATFTGGLFVNSGTLAVDGGNNTNTKAGGTIILNGGTIRNQNAANNTATWQDAITVGLNGGRIESFSTQNAQTNTWTGTMTGSGPLKLRYGGSGTNNSSVVLAPAGASGFSGTITLETANGRGAALFNANSLNSISAGRVTVTAGTAFGVVSQASPSTTALATLTGNIGKFSLNPESILALDNLSGSNLDLSAATGINWDIRLGAAGTVTFSGSVTLTPFGDTYKFAPGGSIVVNTVNWLSGSNNLDLRTGAIVPGAYNVAANANFALNGSQNYTGTTTVTGIVNNSLMGGTTTAPTMVISGGDISAAGATTVAKGGRIQITTLTGKLSGTGSLTISGGGSIQNGDGTAANNNSVTDRIKNTATLTLGGTDGGGTFTMGIAASTFTHAQTLKNLTVNPGDNAISTTGSGGTGTLTFSDPAGSVYTRAAGGTLNISTTAGFTANFTAAPSTNISGTGGAAILVGAFLNNAGFVSATTTAGNPTYTPQNAAGSWASSQNIDTTGAVSGTTSGGTSPATLSINSIRAINGGTLTIGTAAGDSLSLASGMAIFATGGPTINGPGSLTSGNGQDLVISMSGGNTTIAARITGGLPLTIVGAGAGNLHLQSSANAFAGINSYGHRILIENAGAWGNPGAISIAGGLVGNNQNTDKTLDSGYTLGIAAVGGTFIQGGTGSLIVQGAVTLNGTLSTSTSNGTIIPDGTVDYQGNISGPGMIAIGFGNRARYLISGANNSGWTGGLLTNATMGAGSGSANIFVFNANSLGLNAVNASPIVLTRAANLYFDTNAAGAVTMNQAIAYNSNSTISFWGRGSGLSTVGGTAPLTWAGPILGSGGLTFQGTATTDNQVSEIVLTNTVSTSGVPTVYSFGTATNAQNFANGQGGIQLGVTGFTGVTANTTTTRVEDGSGASSAVLTGALGFVRFSGANSFIPGAIGPGYISAIRTAGTGQESRFGYLLTAGATYTLPEGKSFVLGSLGNGASVGGTLGASGSGTANLDGGAKSSVGSLLAGYNGGDVNIHANNATSTQSLNLLARDTGTLLVLGNSSTLVFAPTYGDSGLTSTITMLSARNDTGAATTINKIGAGTVEIKNVQFNTPGNTTIDSAKAGFTLNVNAGTLRYTQNDTAVGAGTAFYAATNVASTSILTGTGKLNSNVSIAADGRLAPGSSAANDALTIAGNTTFANTSNLDIRLKNTGVSNSLNLTGGTAFLNFAGGSNLVLTDGGGFTPGTNASYTLATLALNNGSNIQVSGIGVSNNASLGQLTVGGSNLGPVHINATALTGLSNGDVFNLSRSGDAVVLTYTAAAVPEPGAILGLASLALGTLGRIRGRSRRR